MKKVKNRTLIILFISIIILSLASAAVLKIFSQNKIIAEIYVENKLMYTIDLEKVRESYTIKLPHNTVLVEHGRISMLDADCPDKLCIKQGKITDGAYPIVCLPNKVMIKITGKKDVDAVSGR